MEAKLTLYGALFNPKTNKILLTAAYANVTLHRQIMQNIKDTKTPEYLKKHGLGKIPLLETPAGYIFETNSICRYLARLQPSAGLLGNGEFEASQVDQYLDFCATELEPVYVRLVYPILGIRPADPEVQAKAREELNVLLKFLDERLRISTYLVGNQVTLADIAIGLSLVEVYRLIFDAAARNTFQNVTRWFLHLVHLPLFAQTIGRVTLCTSPWQPASLPPPQQAQASEAPKKGVASTAEVKKAATEKGKKPAEAAPSKQEKPAQAQPEEEEKKEKNPLDLLPPSGFNFYDFKTLFANSADKREAMKTFWQQFDPAGFSIWLLHYKKAEGEGVKLFLTSNLANGFLQRLDHFRKYALAVHGVYGQDGKYEVKGCWIWRGTGHPQEIKDQDTYEYHTFTQADPNNAEHRALVEDYMCNTEPGTIVDGLPIAEVSYFK
eukprot:TRINITY_DN3907_c0_g1_i6.p1 TRINITY_DN3907_c0_g1~~TRINITY_DN3907_c0_g1_i6.p1  ORF type:complete len:437 (-),score=113.27 TRINITY_DN3907_c0_g1_i6:136-1446(-)